METGERPIGHSGHVADLASGVFGVGELRLSLCS